MTFRLHRADRAGALADALAGVLVDPPEDPFTAEVVCVHSQGVERWLGHRLSAVLGTAPGRTDGVSANVRFPFPGALVGDALADATGVDRRRDPWRPERLVWPLLEVVDACLSEDFLEVLRIHVGADEPGSSKADRRFGAVRHLADLFDAYATHRPDMLLAWRDGVDADGAGGRLDVDLRWQAELWRRLRGAITAASPAERLDAGCAALAADPGLVDLPARVCLYGMTRLPASYVRVLQAIAEHRDVHLFALHPSPTAWEAVSRIDGGADDEVSRAATLAVAHPLLRAWGRDSREMQLVLASRGIVDDGRPAVTSDEPTTLLARLQADIRADADPARRGPFLCARDDRSVQVHACHGRARQAEIVRDAVTHLFEADPTLEPRDVVVLCPDIDEMAPLFHAAFGAVDAGAPEHLQTGSPALRHRLADRSIRQTNPLLGAVSELLSLVDARLTATQVLTFAGLPPVRERFSIDDDDLDRLSRWVRSAGIRWGIDAGHRDPFDLAAVETGTWRAGLRRLLLGVAMTEDDLRLVGGVLPLDDVDAGDIPLAGRFAELLDRLALVVRRLQPVQPITAWTAALRTAADLLLHTRPADAWQRAQLDRLLGDVEDQAAATAGTGLRLTEVRDLLADRLRGQPTRAAFRSGDITLCTLVPMRSVPHRVVCVVGLDDGAFPRGSRADGDDVLLRNRRLGDHDRPTEDRQLLLDAVLAAGDALVVTYAGRDERTNERLPAAVPVQELLQTVTATAPGAAVCVDHPLHAADPTAFEAGPDGRPWSYDRVDLAGARAWAAAPVPAEPFLPGPLPPLTGDVIALDELVAFVQHPARSFLRTRLGLSLRSFDDRPLDAIDVAVDALATWQFGDRVLRALVEGADIEAACDAERARGLLPPGALGDRVLEAVRPKALAVARATSAAAQGDRTSLEVDVELADGRRIVGTVADVVRPTVGGPVIRTATYSTIKGKQRLAAWVRYLGAVASHADETVTSATVGWSWGKAVVVGTTPLAGTAPGRHAEAVRHLSTVVDLYDRGMQEPLPLFCETTHAWVTTDPGGRRTPYEVAKKEWESEFGWPKEDADAEHVLVLGSKRSLDEVLDEAPRPDEDGPGWRSDEPSRFVRLGHRLWDPVLAHTTWRPVQDEHGELGP